MTAIRGASRQPFVGGGIPTSDPITRVLFKIGQVSPQTQRRWKMAHGRFLAGLGGNETQPAFAAKRDEYVTSLEKDDDVFGSGIFDTYGRSPTVNKDLGVFADHPSLPGFIDREISFTVNTSITDITSGADVVSVPAGGMTYQEKQRFPTPYDRTGPTPCPPDLRPPPPTAVDQVYAVLSSTAVPRPKLPDHLPQYTWAGVARTPSNQALPPQPLLPSMVPASLPPTQRTLNGPYPTTISTPVGTPFNPQLIPYSTPSMFVPARNISTTGDRIQPLQPARAASGFGADAAPSGPGIGTYLFAGLLVGVAGHFLLGKKKGSR